MALGTMWFLLSLVLDNVNDLIMKYVGGSMGSQQVIFIRFLSSTVMLLPLMILRHSSKKLTQESTQEAKTHIHIHIVRSFLLYMGMVLWCFGLSYVPMAMATSINFIIPIFILIFARFFLQERLTFGKISSTFLGFLGVLVVILPWSQKNGVGQIFGSKVLILSAMIFALLDIVNKRFVEKESTLSMLFYSGFFVTLFSAIPAGMQWVSPSTSSVMFLILLGLTGNFILYCLLKAFSYVEITAVAPYRYLELTLSAFLGYAVFSEIPHTTTYMGAGLIALSSLILIYEKPLNRWLSDFRIFG
jgi:S-adenosylmethionine uptake transporter